MILLPAIDLIGGRCVRLAQGDFSRETSYSDDPSAALDAFADAGATEAHLVDLDGAKAGAPRQHDLLNYLARRAGLKLQVAGGFRTAEQVGAALDAGVQRVVIGSLAVTDPAAFAAMLDRFGPDRLTLALDVRVSDGKAFVATHGWTEGTGQELADTLAGFPTVRHLLVTDIARDGMMTGPNLALMRTIARDFPAVELQASGGVSRLAELADLRAAGAARAIVGKAIWEGRFTVAEGVSHARG
ncbi:1-(5-phosphoribosyl)-5-[(5-phosphoribosylamino)methylideneamino] imidazole-4-carboxamide isomerase [Sphingomonas rhizophila]|uniref:1-(5-phosphoribosyl)-5-[(5-phosphoribosylamino)methylideneamino] imidazole-4-carboxamide isomerase n=1 Tax=Sphingomonas rhizophila TaxID=2071607 RepID=A0A7G9SBT3_9SPHN|nr:1-(5-phosphoribosyl)-5-[(5-phosphoribosylamino)methylideneamino] imidazole-4-carboxamide isomerase [Sphingomonas rhizophila]QNN65308.1 1-(5-phosphoribosyl)-5-[(5-phosphoribosylamino)methylideneamino] imidazole-4-carboxamide isomerase [Sphingomonas rhizophila]